MPPEPNVVSSEPARPAGAVAATACGAALNNEPVSPISANDRDHAAMHASSLRVAIFLCVATHHRRRLLAPSGRSRVARVLVRLRRQTIVAAVVCNIRHDHAP